MYCKVTKLSVVSHFECYSALSVECVSECIFLCESLKTTLVEEMNGGRMYQGCTRHSGIDMQANVSVMMVPINSGMVCWFPLETQLYYLMILLHYTREKLLLSCNLLPEMTFSELELLPISHLDIICFLIIPNCSFEVECSKNVVYIFLSRLLVYR